VEIREIVGDEEDEYFGQFYTSREPRTPVSEEQCKDGGYRNLIDPETGQPFKNQGQCVSFVEQQEREQ
jgi:hypothetical protein